MWPRLPSSMRSSCYHLSSAGIIGVYHHGWLIYGFLNNALTKLLYLPFPVSSSPPAKDSEVEV